MPRRNTEGDHPLAYFLTFTTYGSWLHGEDRRSVDAAHAAFESFRIAPNAIRRAVMTAHMKGAALLLTFV
jgi:hypothetical protein